MFQAVHALLLASLKMRAVKALMVCIMHSGFLLLTVSIMCTTASLPGGSRSGVTNVALLAGPKKVVVPLMPTCRKRGVLGVGLSFRPST